MAGPQLPVDLDDLLGAFGQFFSSSHVSVTIEITEEEAIAGVTRDVTFGRWLPCPACEGRGSTNPDAIISTCKACNGAGKKSHAQGFFTVSTACESCNGDAKYNSDPCATCEGRGSTLQNTTQSVAIPAGVAHEQRLRLTGAGSQQADGTRGDVYITVLLAGRPRSKPPMPTHYMEPAAAPLPQARVHRSEPAGRPFIVYGVVIAAIAVLALLAILK